MRSHFGVKDAVAMGGRRSLMHRTARQLRMHETTEIIDTQRYTRLYVCQRRRKKEEEAERDCLPITLCVHMIVVRY